MIQLSLLPDASAPLRRPTEPIARDALVKNGCRFWLKRAWGSGPCILWAMCNPSDANGKRDDPTMWRVMEFSLRWGYGSCIVVNVVPVISPEPALALAWCNRLGPQLRSGGGPDWDAWNSNIYHCAQIIPQASAQVAAWGNMLDIDFVEGWRTAIAEATDFNFDEDFPDPVEWLCLGTNSNGSPRHPLSRGKNRVPADFMPVRWKQ